MKVKARICALEMIVPPKPKNEPRRLEELRSYDILDTLPEIEYDEITFLASQICGTPVSMITFIDEKRQWFKSHPGMPVDQSPKEISFCAHAINDPQKMMIVSDTREDERFHDNPVVTGPPHVVFYAGIPLVSPKGYALGTLCVGDNKPHELSPIQVRSLRSLSKQVMKLLELRKKSAELQRKNEDILAGIYYARKIQYSILPAKSDIRKDIPGAFVYFRPKDVIGGDFHWVFRRNNWHYLATIDCTGHGVPGALMSMSVHSLLNEVMLEERHSRPGNILGALHQKIYRALQQRKGDQYAQDGCDMALCAIDLKNAIIEYSGARIGLYLSNGKKVRNIQPDYLSVGGASLSGKNEPVREFTTKRIKLQDETLLAMSTDGILEQLNLQDEAFGATRFKNMLLAMKDMSVMEMNVLIRNEMKNWLKGTVQQDDMLFVGLKLNRDHD